MLAGYAQLAAGVAPSPLTTAGHYAPVRVARFELGTLHRNASVLTLAFLAVYITTADADSFVHLGWLVTVIPSGGSYRPLWLGLGTFAFDLQPAGALTSSMRLRLGAGRWKAVHRSAYAAWHCSTRWAPARSPAA